MVFWNLFFVVAAFCGMEGVAWLAHKYVMHGFLWMLHEDHHQKNPTSFFERNDYFFIIFAIPGILGLYYGMHAHYNFLFWIGLGITLYGFAYFFVHDIFIHQRFRWLRYTDNAYFRAIRRAHKTHHKYTQKDDGECFGMLWVPVAFFKKEH